MIGFSKMFKMGGGSRFKCKKGSVQKPPHSRNCKKKTSRKRCKNGTRRNRVTRRCRRKNKTVSSASSASSKSETSETLKKVSPLFASISR